MRVEEEEQEQEEEEEEPEEVGAGQDGADTNQKWARSLADTSSIPTNAAPY